MDDKFSISSQWLSGEKSCVAKCHPIVIPGSLLVVMRIII